MRNAEYIEYPTVINAVDADTAYTSDAHDCRGMAIARGVGRPVGLVDAGGIDQTIDLQGSVNGVLWTDIENPFITLTDADTAIESELADIRCYSYVRAVYNNEGATAGTISFWLNLLPIKPDAAPIK